MTFSRVTPLFATYMLNDCPLERITLVDDLGVRLDPKLSFSEHISCMVNKARGMLGFIKRWAKEFDSPYVTKTLFTSLVRPILEYGSCVWSPQFGVHSHRIESVQKNFLLFALRGLSWDANLRLPSYSSRLLLINLPTLANRRTMLGVVFLHKLVNGDVESPYLLGLLNFHVPRLTSRTYIPLVVNHCRREFEVHEPFRVLCSDYNRLFNSFEGIESLQKLKTVLLVELARIVS